MLLVGNMTGLLLEITSATGRHNIGVREEEQWMTVLVNTYMVDIIMGSKEIGDPDSRPPGGGFNFMQVPDVMAAP